MAAPTPALQMWISTLHVLSREFAGVGSYTTFMSPAAVQGLDGTPIHLPIPINMPGVRHGMGAVLFFKEGRPDTLETYTFGNEKWNGAYDGFSIPDPTDRRALYNAFGTRRPSRSTSVKAQTKKPK